jgi:plastocyanin
MKRAGLAAVLVAALAAAAPAAVAATFPVSVEFQAFAPTPLDVLPGETVEWTNVSERRHTITADDGAFDSGDVFGGDRFTQTFDAVGAYPYHCRVHAGMTGEVDVRRVTLGVFPTAAIPAGDLVDVDGRTADPAIPVRIERDTGSGFETVATATPAGDGTWRAKVTAERTADYRAAVGSGTSETRRLLVSDRRVLARATPSGVAVTVVPSLPYARVVLLLDLRERFGWWPVLATQLDYVSQAVFHVRGPVHARAVLIDTDGWTALATSQVVTVRRRARR